jgi:hypothetical protein
MTTSPRPWHTGTSEASEGLTLYSHKDNAPRGKIIGFMRDTDNAKHLVEAVEALDSLHGHLALVYQVGRQDQLAGADYRNEFWLAALVGFEHTLPAPSTPPSEGGPNASRVLEDAGGNLPAAYQESEKRRRIAAVVACHHQEYVTGGGTAEFGYVIDAFGAVLAALGGATDPVSLGILDSPTAVEQVRLILDSQDGDRDA